jgi:putative FmdB family regulatory protein
MPIYEFYCAACHALYSFLARRPSAKRPRCPRCGRPRLERKASAFAVSTGRLPAVDDGQDNCGTDGRLEGVMEELAHDVERIDESDPRQMAGLMRRFFDRSGMPLGAGVEEAIRRMEAGEDPAQVEREMGDLLEHDEEAVQRQRPRVGPPRVDPQLYEL